MALFGLLGDQNDPRGGLLSSLLKPYDISAGYTGSLAKDPSTGLLNPDVQSAFRDRALAGVANAFAEGGMPVPYKGGIPLLSTIGRAPSAGYASMDELVKARLQEAQTQQAQAQAGNLQAQLEMNRWAAHQINNPNSIMAGGSGADPNAPGGGKKELTGPAKLLAASQGQVTPQMLYSFLTDNGANKNEATAITSGMINESGGNPNLEHDREILAARGLPPGYGLFGDNGTNLTKMREFAGVGPNDPVPWQQQALFALQSLRPGGIEAKAGARINAATNPEQLTDGQLAWLRPKDWNSGGGNRDQRLASTSALYAAPPYQPTTPDQFAQGALQPPGQQTASAAPPGAPAGLLNDPRPIPSDFAPVAGPNAGKINQASYNDALAAWEARNPGGAPAPAPAWPPMAPPQPKPPGLLTPQGAAAAGASAVPPP